MFRIVIPFIIFLYSLNISALDCSEIKDDCEYYSCIEEQRHCGKKGYLLGFGKKYCLKFSKLDRLFSEEGKRWIDEVRECLIKSADLSSKSLSCKEFKKEQFKSHVPCYVSSGYCELSRKDRFAVKKVIYKSLWRPSLIWSGMKVVIKCRI